MTNLGSAETNALLEKLRLLGLTDEIYKSIHHAGHSMADMARYEAKHYSAGSRNLLLHRRLDWILRTYRDEFKLPPGRTDVFAALA